LDHFSYHFLSFGRSPFSPVFALTPWITFPIIKTAASNGRLLLYMKRSRPSRGFPRVIQIE
jgi:hypothetical protein